jgi:GT2 family glycosyltransferase
MANKNKAVIIPVHNQLDLLKKCVESVYAKSDDSVFVIIVDDGSDGVTNKWLRQFNYPYYLVTHKHAKGFTESVNDGMRLAIKVKPDTKCFCLLNSDTVIGTNDWYAKVYDMMKNYIGVAGVVSNNALAQSMPYISDKVPGGLTIDEYSEFLLHSVESIDVPCPLVHGFCYFINRFLFDEIGYLDQDDFPHYGSEDDYSIKALDKGFTNVIVPYVYVWHKASASYTHDKRDEMIKTTLPLLRKKHTKEKVHQLCVKSTKCLNEIKESIYNKVKEIQPKPTLKLGLLINCYERPDELKRTLDSLKKSAIPVGTLIVIINDASTDTMVQPLIDSLNMKNVKILRWRNMVNKGIVENLRDGFEYLFNNDCDFLCNLDSDAEVQPDWLIRLHEVHEQNRPCFVTGFNAKHPMFKHIEERHNCIKIPYLLGINMYFENTMYMMVYNALKANLSFDFELSGIAEDKGIPIYVTKPSVVEHIGEKSTLKHTGELKSKEHYEKQDTTPDS